MLLFPDIKRKGEGDIYIGRKRERQMNRWIDGQIEREEEMPVPKLQEIQQKHMLLAQLEFDPIEEYDTFYHAYKLTYIFKFQWEILENL